MLTFLFWCFAIFVVLCIIGTIEGAIQVVINGILSFIFQRDVRLEVGPAMLLVSTVALLVFGLLHGGS